MKIGIDSYCYHRFFGEVYPEQQPPPRRMSLEDFLRRARDLEVDGVSLESCFFPRHDWSYLASLKKLLDEYGLERVYAWGHPDGLEGGTNKEAYDDMIASIERAKAIGADVMRSLAAASSSASSRTSRKSRGSAKCFPRRFRLPRNTASAWR